MQCVDSGSSQYCLSKNKKPRGSCLLYLKMLSLRSVVLDGLLGMPSILASRSQQPKELPSLRTRESSRSQSREVMTFISLFASQFAVNSRPSLPKLRNCETAVLESCQTGPNILITVNSNRDPEPPARQMPKQIPAERSLDLSINRDINISILLHRESPVERTKTKHPSPQ